MSLLLREARWRSHAVTAAGRQKSPSVRSSPLSRRTLQTIHRRVDSLNPRWPAGFNNQSTRGMRVLSSDNNASDTLRAESAELLLLNASIQPDHSDKQYNTTSTPKPTRSSASHPSDFFGKRKNAVRLQHVVTRDGHSPMALHQI